MKKILFAAGAILAIFLLLPLYVALFESPAGKEGWYFTMFLAINPILSGLLGLLAGTDVKKLWLVPVLVAATFPLGFWLSVREIETDIFVYCPIYLAISLIAMLISHLITDRSKKKKKS